MLRYRIFITFLAMTFLLVGVSARPALGSLPAQGSEGQFFNDTGFWVRGDFLTFYNNAPDPARLFGNPISDVLPDPIRPGLEIQYFERARLDRDPSAPPGSRITLAKLGQLLHDETRPGEAIDFSTNSNMCRTFANRKLVCYAFLQFYERYNGPVYFGQPISDTEMLDGRLVQYFERARLEWRTDRPSGQRVVLTELGRIDMDLRIGEQVIENNATRTVQLNLAAFVNHPVEAAGQNQQVFVVVSDQNHTPLPGISVMVTAAYPDGSVENFRTDQSSSDGLTTTSFPVKNLPPNQIVRITVSADVPGLPKANAYTWFRIWW